ncbi:MAG: hypothetical protein QW153_00670 [Candidatus Bilamarchaeaceae archaeon]
MKFIIYLAVLLGLVLLSGAIFADCSLEAYKQACANCRFDQNGKIDRSCSDIYKASALACISKSYPIMSGKYHAGQCPQVDECASQLSSCIADVSTGNDKYDCQEGSMTTCYSAADRCIANAAIKCGEVEKECPGSSGLILLVLGLVGFYSTNKK